MRKPVAITAAIIAATAALGSAGDSQAKGKGSGASKAATARVVALSPLATLGSEAKSKATKKAQKAIVAGFASLANVKLVSMAALRRAVKKAKRPRLRSCDGDPQCLAELGQLMKAESVVYGEIGGLGDVQVVYLKLVNVSDAREVRSTTLEIVDATTAEQAARAAAFRLLEPTRYVGRLAVTVDAKKASIYVDGKLVAKSPTKPVALPVGTHALRVTHPEYRDFVRFVKIEFDEDLKIEAGLQRYRVIRSEVGVKPGGADPTAGVIYRGVEPTPWYRRWYTVAGGSTILLVGSAVIVGLIVNGIDADRERTVGEE